MEKYRSGVKNLLRRSQIVRFPVQGDLLRRHIKRFENLPEDIRVSKASEDSGFVRKFSQVQYFMTIHVMDLTGFGYPGSCREYTSPRSDERSTPKGWIRGKPKIGPILEAK